MSDDSLRIKSHLFFINRSICSPVVKYVTVRERHKDVGLCCAIAHRRLKVVCRDIVYSINIKKNEVGRLLVILLGNIAGCICMGLLARFSPMDIRQAAQNIFEARVQMGPLTCGLLAIPCGFMMTTSVTFARKQHYIPLLLAVPLFIVCGFTHCIADAFTYSCVPIHTLGSNFGSLMMIYLPTVIGNFIGCNLFRILVPEENQSNK